MKRAIETIKAGDTILPPEREVRLWMRRRLAEEGLPESALHLTVVDVWAGQPDKKGSWIIVKGRHEPAWNKGFIEPDRDHFMTFKARPGTLWTVV